MINEEVTRQVIAVKKKALHLTAREIVKLIKMLLNKVEKEKNGLEDFIDKQNKRKIATKFYEFIKEEFIEKPLKTKEKELTDEFRKSESKKNKQNFQVLEKYLLYIFGKKRMEKELDKVKKTEVE